MGNSSLQMKIYVNLRNFRNKNRRTKTDNKKMKIASYSVIDLIKYLYPD